MALVMTILFLSTGPSMAGEMVFGTVQGKVIDSSGNFVRGASVSIGEQDRREVFRTDQGYTTMQVGRKEGLTDTYGDFEIKSVVTGYQPIVIRVGSRIRIKDMIVVERGVNEYNFTLPPDGKVSSNFFQSAVYGKVVDGNSRLPVSGVKMEINGKTAESGADGSFQVEWVPPGYHFIYGVREGYKDYVQRAEVRKGDNYFEIVMDPRKSQAIIASKVVDDVTGDPLSQVAVNVDNRKVYTSAEGSFQVMVEKGRHHVMEISHAGYDAYSSYVFAEQDQTLPAIVLKRKKYSASYSGDGSVAQASASSTTKKLESLRDRESFSPLPVSGTGDDSRDFRGPEENSHPDPCDTAQSGVEKRPRSIDWSTIEKSRSESGRSESGKSGSSHGRHSSRVAYREGEAPSISGVTGGFMLPDTRTNEKGKTALSTRFLRLASGDAKELVYSASVSHGVAENLEVGISSVRTEDESGGNLIRKDTDTSFFFKYRPLEYRNGQGLALGTSMSGDVLSPFASYGFPLSAGGRRSGDMSMLLRRNIQKGTSYNDYGVGMRVYLNNSFDLIMEGLRESLLDSSVYNLGFRYNGDNTLKLDLYASWLFDVKDINGVGAGLTWAF
jgi:hypothetical protein